MQVTTASEQFVQDYLLVMDNDVDAWRDYMSTAKQYDSVAEFSQHLRNEWDEYIDNIVTLVEKEWGSNAPATLLIRQIMGGWGDSEWFAIAKHYKEVSNG